MIPRHTSGTRDGISYFEFKPTVTSPTVRIEWPEDSPFILIPGADATALIKLGYARTITDDLLSRYESIRAENAAAVEQADALAAEEAAKLAAEEAAKLTPPPPPPPPPPKDENPPPPVDKAAEARAAADKAAKEAADAKAKADAAKKGK